MRLQLRIALLKTSKSESRGRYLAVPDHTGEAHPRLQRLVLSGCVDGAVALALCCRSHSAMVPREVHCGARSTKGAHPATPGRRSRMAVLSARFSNGHHPMVPRCPHTIRSLQTAHFQVEKKNLRSWVVMETCNAPRNCRSIFDVRKSSHNSRHQSRMKAKAELRKSKEIVKFVTRATQAFEPCSGRNRQDQCAAHCHQHRSRVPHENCHELFRRKRRSDCKSMYAVCVTNVPKPSSTTGSTMFSRASFRFNASLQKALS